MALQSFSLSVNCHDAYVRVNRKGTDRTICKVILMILMNICTGSVLFKDRMSLRT